MTDLSFVRTEMLPERAPPPSTTGVIGWLRKNLFDGWLNSALTIVSLLFVFWVLDHLFVWGISPTWSDGSLDQCRTTISEAGWGGACWGVIRERWPQMLYGFYPEELRIRPTLAFFLLFIALIPVLFSMISRRMNWLLLTLVLLAFTFAVESSGLIIAARVVLAAAALWIGVLLVRVPTGEEREEQIKQGAGRLPNPLWFTALYIFLMPWLLWGGTVWTPVAVALGIVIGGLAFRLLSPMTGTLAALIVAVVATILWWLLLSGPFADMMHGIFPIGLEPVKSRLFGGLMLSITIGVVAIAVSLPLGIVLALGRQSDLLIVKYLSVIFIEFIRGVPLITLLFVASVLLNIFMPPGTNFDIILRVIIMATIFSAAYMAEVIRGGLAALPKGQYEAADALGLDYWKAQRLVIMPQALKISIPGIVSTFIGLFKDTTLVSIIGLMDPIGLSNAIRADANWNGIVWELYGFIALMFFIFTFSMSRYSMYLERRLRTDHR